MLRLLISVTLLVLAPGEPAAPTCAMRGGAGIACGTEDAGPENAADAFATYGFDRAAIMSEATRAYLQRFGCARVVDNGHGVPIRIWRGVYEIAEPRDTVKVRQIVTHGAGDSQVFWIAEPYLKGRCLVEGDPSRIAVF